MKWEAKILQNHYASKVNKICFLVLYVHVDYAEISVHKKYDIQFYLSSTIIEIE